MEEDNLNTDMSDAVTYITDITEYFTEITTVSYGNTTVTNSGGFDQQPGGGHGGGGRRRFIPQVLSFEIQILVSCICGFIIFMTVFGNLLVLFSYFTNRHLRTYANYFICGLAMVDLIEGLFVQPLYAAYWILGVWPFATQVCEAYKYIHHITGHTTYLFTLVICIDRYRALTKPFEHLKERTYRHAIFLMALAWLIPILSWFGPLLIWPKFGEIHPFQLFNIFCIPYYSISKPFTLFVTIYVSWIPISMICVMYIRIFIVMKEAAKMKGRTNTLTLNKKLRNRSRSDSQFSIKIKDNKPKKCVINKGVENKGYDNNEEANQETIEKEENINESRSTIEADDFEKADKTSPSQEATENTNESKNPIADDIKQRAKTGPRQVLTALHVATVTSVSFGVQNPSKGLERRRSSAAQPSKDRIQRQNIRATKVLSMIVAVVLVSRVPWSVIAIYNVLCGSTCLPKYVVQAILFTSHLPSALNPLCYAVANPKFKNAFIRILCCFRCRRVKQPNFQVETNSSMM